MISSISGCIVSTQPYLSCSSYRAWSVWSSPTQLQESHRPACPTSTLPLPGLALQHYSSGKATLLSPDSSSVVQIPRPTPVLLYCGLPWWWGRDGLRWSEGCSQDSGQGQDCKSNWDSDSDNHNDIRAGLLISVLCDPPWNFTSGVQR